MDFRLAVTVNKDHLLGIGSMLISMVGGVTANTVTRRTLLVVLSLLRPAESATRRLIAVLAHRVILQERGTRAAPTGKIPKGDSEGKHVPAFPLFDRRKRVGPVDPCVPGLGPNVRFLDEARPQFPQKPEISPDDPVDARAVIRRIESMMAALGNLDRQAVRMARALAKKPRPMRAIRPGRPPGHRAMLAGGRYRHFVDEVLADCHELALMALNEPPAKAPP